LIFIYFFNFKIAYFAVNAIFGNPVESNFSQRTHNAVLKYDNNMRTAETQEGKC